MASLFTATRLQPSSSNLNPKSKFFLRDSFFISDRDSLHHSYAQIVEEGVPRCWNRHGSKNWTVKKGYKICFRYGDRDHITYQCRDPVWCFAYGKCGHKRFSCPILFEPSYGAQELIESDNSGFKENSCWMKSKSIDSGPQFIDHGFQFTLKCMLLKGILLDNLWQKRNEGIQLFEDLFTHFDVTYSPNIGKGYRERFGDLEDYFGNSEVFLKKSDDKGESTDVLLDYKGNLNYELSANAKEEESIGSDPMLVDCAVIQYSLDSNVSVVNKMKNSSVSVLDNLGKGNVYELSNGFNRVKGYIPKSQKMGNYKIKTDNIFNSQAVDDKEDNDFGLEFSDIIIDSCNSFCNSDSKFNVMGSNSEISLIDGSSEKLDEVTMLHHGEVFDGFLLSSSPINVYMIFEKDLLKNLVSSVVPVDVHACVSILDLYSSESKFSPDFSLVEDNPLEWFIESVADEVLIEKEVFVHFDKLLEIRDDKSLSSTKVSTDMHICTEDVHANFTVYKDDNVEDKQRIHSICLIEKLTGDREMGITPVSCIFSLKKAITNQLALGSLAERSIHVDPDSASGDSVFSLSSCVVLGNSVGGEAMRRLSLVASVDIRDDAALSVNVIPIVTAYSYPKADVELVNKDLDDENLDDIKNDVCSSFLTEDVGSDRNVYYWTGGFRFVMYCFLATLGKFPCSPAHAKELIREAKLSREAKLRSRRCKN